MLSICLYLNSIRASAYSNNANNIYNIKKYDHNIKYLRKASFGYINKKYRSGKRISVFFGFKECPYCQRFSYKLQSISKRHLIYYLNIDSLRNHYNIMKKLSKNFKIKEFPTLETFHNGKIASKIVGSNGNIRNFKF